MNVKRVFNTQIIISIVLLVTAIALWIVEITCSNSLEMGGAAVLASALFLCFLAVGIAKIISKKLSGFLTFAITDAVLLLITLLFAFYDYMTADGIAAGLFGYVLMIVVVPILGITLIVELIIWAIKAKSKRKQE